jgi:transcriptional regulator of acetoin/glycerol metabolism
VDEKALLRALEKTAWNKAKAARLLGVDRKTVYRNMEKYHITGDDKPERRVAPHN